MSSTVWLLVAFIIFFLFAFKTIKRTLINKISEYERSIKNSLISSEQKVHESEDLLRQLEFKTKEIEEICYKIQSNVLLESEKIKREASLQISSYLTFKENYTEEKLKIFSYDKISMLKLKIINSAVLVAEGYIKSNGTHESIDSNENLDTLFSKVILD